MIGEATRCLTVQTNNKQTVGICGNFDAFFEHAGGTAVQHRYQFTERFLDTVAFSGHVGRTQTGKVGHVSGELFQRQALDVVVVEQQVGADLIQYSVNPRRSHVLHLRQQQVSKT